MENLDIRYDNVKLNMFNEINSKFFENKLNIKEKIFLKGNYNFVLIVEYKLTIFALRIPQKTYSEEMQKFTYSEEIQKSYENTTKLYEKLNSILPKIKQINTLEPYFILYEYFEYNVYDYLIKFKDVDSKIEEFNNIINQCIDHIQVVYDNNIRCVDIKPRNFILKFDESKNPIVKMIDIDECFIQDNTMMQDINKQLLLLMTLYQFYFFLIIIL